jgi:hypothetical protein
MHLPCAQRISEFYVPPTHTDPLLKLSADSMDVLVRSLSYSSRGQVYGFDADINGLYNNIFCQLVVTL